MFSYPEFVYGKHSGRWEYVTVGFEEMTYPFHAPAYMTRATPIDQRVRALVTKEQGASLDF